MSDAARWSEPAAATTGRRNIWLACLIALTGLLVLGNLANDAALDVKFGWDVRVNCAAVDAYAGGLDPYFVKNLKGTKLSYPYLPVTLDVFRPLCAGGVLVDHYRSIFLVLAVLCGLLLPGLARTRPSARDAALRVLCAIGAFVGFEWVEASGNFALLSGVLTAVALKLLLRPLRSEAGGDQDFTWRLAGAALLGLVTSFKLVFFPVLAALYFLPLPRGRKLALIAVAILSFVVPILISKLLYPDLFASWQLAMAGQIPDQHHVDLLETNPSLLLLALSLMEHAGLGDGKPALFASYALAALALVLVPFGLSVLRMVGSRPAGGGRSHMLSRGLSAGLLRLSRLRERPTRSQSAAGEGSRRAGTYSANSQQPQRGDTLSPTLPRKRGREPSADAAASCTPYAIALPAGGGASLLMRLDLWLMDHPRTAMRVTVLAMFALYLSSPRLKEYAFFELALYAAILIVDLPAMALAAMLTVGLAFPTLISLLGAPFEGSFILLVISLICFWIVLLDFRAEPKRLEHG
ncbi:hypothetical protein [Bradyrhizobium forestalis]|uniref:hypothetical protein n=1 Tax=Bradyrhizobium forestalis TaxID=1419263 RepID=UPI001FE05C82|nr:hypothetical protein [Bradyrhizobium forestalis]